MNKELQKTLEPHGSPLKEKERGVLANLANLRGANLKDANLRGANLKGAYLQKANLKNPRDTEF